MIKKVFLNTWPRKWDKQLELHFQTGKRIRGGAQVNAYKNKINAGSIFLIYQPSIAGVRYIFITTGRPYSDKNAPKAKWVVDLGGGIILQNVLTMKEIKKGDVAHRDLMRFADIREVYGSAWKRIRKTIIEKNGVLNIFAEI